MDSGGTFWQTFGGLQGGAAEQSRIDQLLEAPDSTVDQLLEEEEIIQEFKACNEKLLERLCQPEAVSTLIEYVIVEPHPDAPSNRCHLYPFVAAELITCEVDTFLEVFMKPENSFLLDKLWGFLDVEPASEVNPVLAGYFSRAAAAVHAKHPAGVVQYLRHRGAETLLHRFLERLHSRSLAELFVRLLCAEQPSQVVFPIDGLVLSILDRLEADRGPSSDAQENITLIVDELLGQKDALCYADELIRQLAAPQAITSLVNCLFSSCAPSVSAAVSILSSVVFHTYVAPRSTYGTPTMRCGKPSVSDNSDDLVNIGADDEDGHEARPSSPSSDLALANGAMDCRGVTNAQLETYGTAFVDEICLHIPRIGGLLQAALVRSQALDSPIGKVDSVGATALEVVCLLTTVVKTGRSVVFEAFLKEHLLNRCLDMFFRHPWSSLLHNSVKSLLSEILGAHDGARPRLVLSLLVDAGFAERAVEEFRQELAERPDSARRPRVGYMGHLHAMCQELEEFSRVVHPVREKIAAVDGWDSVVAPRLEWLRALQAQPLGGACPNDSGGISDRGWAGSSSNVPAASSRSREEDDDEDDGLGESPTGSMPGRFSNGDLGDFDNGLNLLDQRDVDEELDARRVFNADGSTGDDFDPSNGGASQAWVASFAPPPRSDSKEAVRGPLPGGESPEPPFGGAVAAPASSSAFGAEGGWAADFADFSAHSPAGDVTRPTTSLERNDGGWSADFPEFDAEPTGDGSRPATSLAEKYDDDL